MLGLTTDLLKEFSRHFSAVTYVLMRWICRKKHIIFHNSQINVCRNGKINPTKPFYEKWWMKMSHKWNFMEKSLSDIPKCHFSIFLSMSRLSHSQNHISGPAWPIWLKFELTVLDWSVPQEVFPFSQNEENKNVPKLHELWDISDHFGKKVGRSQNLYFSAIFGCSKK